MLFVHIITANFLQKRQLLYITKREKLRKTANRCRRVGRITFRPRVPQAGALRHIQMAPYPEITAPRQSTRDTAEIVGGWSSVRRVCALGSWASGRPEPLRSFGGASLLLCGQYGSPACKSRGASGGDFPAWGLQRCLPKFFGWLAMYSL